MDCPPFGRDGRAWRPVGHGQLGALAATASSRMRGIELRTVWALGVRHAAFIVGYQSCTPREYRTTRRRTGQRYGVRSLATALFARRVRRRRAEEDRFKGWGHQHLFVGPGVIKAGCKDRNRLLSRSSPARSGPSEEPTPSLPDRKRVV